MAEVRQGFLEEAAFCLTKEKNTEKGKKCPGAINGRKMSFLGRVTLPAGGVQMIPYLRWFNLRFSDFMMAKAIRIQ